MALTATTLTTTAQRKETVLRDGWKFSRGEQFVTMNAIAPSLVGFNDRNWQRTHELINGSLFCTIEIWNDKINQWIKKQDVGTESYTEKEKGQASDSFKRAGFNVGIGRELYTSPFIWIMPKADMKPYNTKDVDGNEANEFYAYKQDGYNKAYTTKTQFKVTDIGYNENKEINKLIIKDNKGNIRYQMDETKDLDLTLKFHNILLETGTDLQDIEDYFKVPYEQFTDEQKEEAIKIMNKKKR